jgi:hypothetical protein
LQCATARSLAFEFSVGASSVLSYLVVWKLSFYDIIVGGRFRNCSNGIVLHAISNVDAGFLAAASYLAAMSYRHGAQGWGKILSLVRTENEPARGENEKREI